MSVNNLSEFGLAKAVLAEAGLSRLDCVEILWDNYCHLDPGALAAMVARFSDRVSMHVMWSQFLERDAESWKAYLAQLRAHVRVLRPIAVSDHLCRFRSEALRLLIPQEHDYRALDHVCERVSEYQEALQQPLALENFASTEIHATRQIEFLDAVSARTGCGILFDVSNAVVGELNGLGPVDLWLQWLAGRTIQLHVGSYAFNEGSGLYHDTHNSDVSTETTRRLTEAMQVMRVTSVCYERDYQKTVASMAGDLRSIHAAVLA